MLFLEESVARRLREGLAVDRSDPVDLEAELADHGGPGGDLPLDQVAEILGRATDQVESGSVHLFDDVGLLEDRVDLGIEPGDDRLRRCGRHHDAVPRQRLESRVARFGDRRQVGEQRESPCRRDRERAQLARLYLRLQRLHDREHHLRLALHRGRDGGRRAVERDVHRIEAGHGLEQLHVEVRRAAVADRRVAELARVGLGVGDQFLQRCARAAAH